ncbi:competence protein ComFA [Bacillus sp. SORGH_AS 510]|uniref:DEAD/DEAH box helicase n=1 Tax=Bacillus sp. SORGH_AS_0510 TaxID=3041771 RepID=UPI00278A55B2|nr:DEAD/DEAH box helicase [Bacillus sp. SORGH_AS_0510]MDQ1144347.1 competence protein ComFA [Bacillus sp. SORGH_AS_0510]
MRFIVKDGQLFPDRTHSDSLPITQIPMIPLPQLNPLFPSNPKLQMILSGKQLLLEDIPFPPKEIQIHYQNGYISYRKGIERRGNKLVCNRCGNKDSQEFGSFPCSRCGERCHYCRHCLMMGRISECTPLISWTGPPPDYQLPEKILAWKGALSEGQSVASLHVAEAILQNREHLIWAVCGAGKTEVLFAGIEAALQAKKRICIATPRTDVVLELTPRLKAAFPEITIASLYGGSEDRHLYAPLTIATTHQLLRFYHAFDAIILDEVDAFPYTVEESLQFAAHQARKPISAMIYLTATPSEKWQKECRTGKRSFTTIPARFHRHPLPVPEFSWCGNWQKRLEKGKLPSNVLRWVQHRANKNKQVLLFFPHIPLMEKALKILQHFFPTIEAVHAEDPDRKIKVQRMRNKQTDILLTTTILERGVTFPNIDVAVIGAEDSIFTESALVQIAGRAGRSKDYPKGSVTFFHFGKTDEMLKARRQIVTMNREGLKRGLLNS